MPVTVLDSFALIAYFRGEQAGVPVKELLQKARKADKPVHMTEVNHAEAKHMIVRKDGAAAWAEASKVLVALPIEFQPVDRELADLAADFKSRVSFSLADAFATALAKNEMRREVARGITLAATGAKGQDGDPCLTVADQGEGQTPRKFPDTFLSLEKCNKLRIPFVQGKFNMGGTGVLEFCGKNNLQLILSRRSPPIPNGNFDHPTDEEWGFTIVGRAAPAGNRRSSSYTFLAPVVADEVPQKGHVLTFAAKTMPIFHDGAQPWRMMTSSLAPSGPEF